MEVDRIKSRTRRTHSKGNLWVFNNTKNRELFTKYIRLLMDNISDMKTKSPKLSKEALIKIWQATRPNVYKNKKKYSRKNNEIHN